MPVDMALRSNAKTVVWGHIPANAPPALRISSGQTVRIDTVSHQGLIQKDPVEYFGERGVPKDGVLQDAVDIFRRATRPEGAGVHILTGPIHIADAQPGDMIEVRILAVEFRVPYGINATGPGFGVLPDLLQQSIPRIIMLDLERQVARFSSDIEIPLAPFMGIMAVAPPPGSGFTSTKPPGSWGGNMDLKQLTTGATLYLPVFNTGALFYTGDGHAAQGDGEIDGTAIETSVTPTLQFVVHKGKGARMKWPRAEDSRYHFPMGMDPDLDTAMKHAVQEAVDCLRQEGGLSTADAYALASVGVDFRIGEAVNEVKMVYGMIPKKFFKRACPYWADRVENHPSLLRSFQIPLTP
ncbi:MAG: acetamidase/formamidase family protein [Thermodesulfobacteriota bacterium]